MDSIKNTFMGFAALISANIGPQASAQEPSTPDVDWVDSYNNNLHQARARFPLTELSARFGEFPTGQMAVTNTGEVRSVWLTREGTPVYKPAEEILKTSDALMKRYEADVVSAVANGEVPALASGDAAAADAVGETLAAVDFLREDLLRIGLVQAGYKDFVDGLSSYAEIMNENKTPDDYSTYELPLHTPKEYGRIFTDTIIVDPGRQAHIVGIKQTENSINMFGHPVYHAKQVTPVYYDQRDLAEMYKDLIQGEHKFKNSNDLNATISDVRSALTTLVAYDVAKETGYQSAIYKFSSTTSQEWRQQTLADPYAGITDLKPAVAAAKTIPGLNQ